MTYVGQPVRRREDRRLLTGAGSYVDDVPVANALHAAFVRSPHARARVVDLDVSAAQRLPGVRWVITAADLPPGGPPHHLLLLPPTLPDLHVAPWSLLAHDEVRYVGEPIAMVAAEDPYVARDAAALVHVQYEPLPAVTDLDRALQPGAELVHPTLGTNRAFRLTNGSPDTDAALEASDEVVHVSVRQRRLAGAPMEPRAILAQYDGYSDALVVWSSTQSAHAQSHNLAEALGIPDNRLRVITRDVGGGFGLKNQVYGDEAAVAYLAWTRKCAIRWSETRSESLQTTLHGRGIGADVSLGIQRDGRLTAVRVDIWADVGAYVLHETGVPPMSFASSIVGPYAIPKATAIVTGIYSNRVPTSPYRGAGRPEATYALERAVDAAARVIGMDPAEVRRRNFIPPDAFPYATPVRAVYDSGDYLPAFEKALEAAGYQQIRERQKQRADAGRERLVGVGICAYVESSVPGWESGTVRVDRGGHVTLLTGSSAHGQGHHTTFAQVVADTLTVPMEDVEVIHGDTAAVPQGVGTFGSRSAALGGSSALIAAGRVKDKMARIAAHMLEADVADVELVDGRFSLVGAPSRSVPFGAVAAVAHVGMGLPPGVSPGLEATEFFASPGLSFPFGTHVAVVEVQPETGEVEIQRYVSVDDCGTVLNPLLVEGQMHGGLAQGFGQALIEEVVYDGSGQIATGTLLDYALPRADLMPTVELDRTVTPSPHNPLGVKGVGEAGTVAAPPAIVNAVLDALAPLGVTSLEMPLTPQRVWAAIQAAQPSGAPHAARPG